MLHFVKSVHMAEMRKSPFRKCNEMHSCGKSLSKGGTPLYLKVVRMFEVIKKLLMFVLSLRLALLPSFTMVE